MRDNKNIIFEFIESINENGFAFQLLLNRDVISFPIQLDIEAANVLIQQPFYDSILALNSLFSEGLAIPQDDHIQITYNDYFSLPSELFDELKLPLTYQGSIFVDSTSYVGSQNFNLKIALTYDKSGLIWNYKKLGHYILIGKSSFVLNNDTERVFQLAEELNNISATSTIQEIYTKLAQLKSQCDAYNYSYSDYISSQEISFGEKLDIDIQVKNENEIELVPRFSELTNDQQNIINSSSILKKNYVKADNNSRKRIFLTDKGYVNFSKIKNNNRISGSNYREFLENPFQFIDEDVDFDRDKFSDRVKGLKIVSYRAKPFINANENEKLNWFEFDAGIELISSDENISNKIIKMDEFKKKFDNSDETGFMIIDNEMVDFSHSEISNFFNGSVANLTIW